MTVWTSVSMEYVRELAPKLEVYPATPSGVLRLSALGLWEGGATYTSPVIDLGEVCTFSGMFWESIESDTATIDSVAGGNKTLEARFSDTTGPTLNNRGQPWQDEQNPHPSDPTWGEPGIPWTSVHNGIPVEGIEVRYIQWRAIFRTLKPSEITPAIILLLTELGTTILTETGEELGLDG